MTGTITQFHRDRGVASLRGQDGKTYLFWRAAVRGGWFHDLSVGSTVTFDPAPPPRTLEATVVRLMRAPS